MKCAARPERRVAWKLYVGSGLEFVDVPHFELKDHLQLIESIIEQAKRANTKDRVRNQPILESDKAFEITDR